MNELSLPIRDTTSVHSATITGHSIAGKASSRNELRWVRRSTRQKRLPRCIYSTIHHVVIEDNDSQEEEQPIHWQRGPKTPSVK